MFPREVINYLAFAQMQITILTLIINFYEGDIFQKTSRERDFMTFSGIMEKFRQKSIAVYNGSDQ